MIVKKLVIIVLLSMGFAGIPLISAEADSDNSAFFCCSLKEDRVLYPAEPPLQGPDVAEIQQQLKALGYSVKNRDGLYGSELVDLIKKFQSDRNLKPDGIAGPATLREMGKNVEIRVTKLMPPPPGKVSIVIDAVYKTLTVYSDGEPYKTYPVAVGKSKTPTPLGEFKVIQKSRNWGSGFGSRWLGLSVGWGKYGIHGTNKPWSIGSRASHGCIRMHNRNVEELYPWVEVGTSVTIRGRLFDPFYENRSIIRKGARGSAVLAVQRKLQEFGYYKGSLDGIFGWGMEKALKEFQKDRGFEPNGEVSIDIWPALEL